MRFWQRGRHDFRASPLSLGVPLDGTETVVGLRQLDLHYRTHHINTRLEARSRTLGYERYRGPYLHQLTAEDLRKRKPSWSEFFCSGNGSSGWREAYNAPEHLGMLQERMEENLIFYLGNYVHLIGAVAILTIYARPLALIGLMFLAASLYINFIYLGGSLAGPGGDAGGSGGQADLGPMRGLLSVLTWLVLAQTRCVGSILRWISYSSLLVGAHAALRIPPSEYRSKQRPGVPLSDILGYHWGTTPPHPDPHRVLRELLEQMMLRMSLAFEYVRGMFHHYVWATRVAINQRTGLYF
eukprot:jgi/Botrbrau1/9283/Bobra.0111s0010.1